jgi:hypothetical protein
MRLADAQVSPLTIGELALHLQNRGNLALSTRLTRAFIDGASAVEIAPYERQAILEALADAPASLSPVRDSLASGSQPL